MGHEINERVLFLVLFLGIVAIVGPAALFHYWPMKVPPKTDIFDYRR
jgi:hypothetical protein